MTTQARRRVPIYSDGTTEYYIYLGVEADEDGEPWLAPSQITLVDQLRRRLMEVCEQAPTLPPEKPGTGSPAPLSLRAGGKSWKVHRTLAY